MTAKELALMAAGLGAGAVMKDAPAVVMPSEAIVAAVEDLLKELQINPGKSIPPDPPKPQ